MNYTNAFTDMFKNSQDMFKTNFDYSQVAATGRRNMEAASEAGQVIGENVQAISRRQAEIARATVESALKASKDIFTSGTPETNMAKQAEFAKKTFETSISNMREISEMVAKSCFEAFDVINRRAAESMEEVSKVAGAATSTAKKKSA